MHHSLITWTELTRSGIPPEFVVIRKPVETQGQVFEVGEVLAAGSFLNRVRLRQMYEQRRIEPVKWPDNAVAKLNRRFGAGKFYGQPTGGAPPAAMNAKAPRSEKADTGLPFDPGALSLPDEADEVPVSPPPASVQHNNRFGRRK